MAHVGMVSLPKKKLFGLAGWALLILFSSLCAPTAARASCGDYLTILPAGFDAKLPTTHPLSVKTHAIPGSHDPYKPCTGPLCSKGPITPEIPTYVVQPVQDRCHVSNEAVIVTVECGTRILVSSIHPSIHFSSDIFHPPRFSF